MALIKYISDDAHYNEVLARVASVKATLWIGTADIKDLYVKSGPASAARAAAGGCIAETLLYSPLRRYELSGLF